VVGPEPRQSVGVGVTGPAGAAAAASRAVGLAHLGLAALTQRRWLLASASPARLALLRAAGLDPDVAVSGVREDDVEGSPESVVLALARRKADRVAATAGPVAPDVLVLGCDSLLDFEGRALGKPTDAADARRRWAELSGGTGVLRTGHWLIDTASGCSAGEVAATTVHFASPTDAEVAAYVATGEPLAVAGAFTLDGLGGWFVDRIEGDPGTVIGVSLPAVRRLLGRIGVPLTEVWPTQPSPQRPRA